MTILAEGSAAEVALVLDRLNVDRTVKVEMREWGYSPANLMVVPGEVIRFMVSNAGALPYRGTITSVHATFQQRIQS